MARNGIVVSSDSESDSGSGSEITDGQGDLVVAAVSERQGDRGILSGRSD